MEDWIPGAAIALVSAIVGGVLATGGAVWVMRRERTRVHRERIFADLLPGVVSQLDSTGFRYNFAEGRKRAAELERVARIASGEDGKQATLIHFLSIEAAAAWDRAELSDTHQRAAKDTEAREKLFAAIEKAKEYETWLETKF
jgi:hypothetical protein